MSLNIRYFLVFMPVAILAWVPSLSPVLVFILAMIGIIPLASLLAESTEVLAYKTGPKIGSLLNATFGNAVDLILLFALLLVVGLSQLMGGFEERHPAFR